MKKQESLNRPPTILVTNIVTLNPGDAAILQGMMEILRRRYGGDVRIIVFDRKADAARKYFPWATFRQALFTGRGISRVGRVIESWGYGHWLGRLRYARYRSYVACKKWGMGLLGRVLVNREEAESLDEYLDADLILSSGGTYLIENYSLDTPIRDYRLTLATGTPLGFFTQTLGPFHKPKHRIAFARIFSGAAVIIVRDEQSRQHIADLGVTTEKVFLAADAAFALGDGQSADSRPVSPSVSPVDTHPLRVAVSVRSVANFLDGSRYPLREDDYLRAVGRAVTTLVRDHGAEVVFISTCQGIREYWTDDSSTADLVLRYVDDTAKPHVTVDRKFRDPQDIILTYKTFDMVLATRMHAAILAICAGTPVAGIAYEFKMEALFERLGLQDLLVTFGGWNDNSVTQVMSTLSGKRKHYMMTVSKAREHLVEDAHDSGLLLPLER